MHYAYFNQTVFKIMKYLRDQSIDFLKNTEHQCSHFSALKNRNIKKIIEAISSPPSNVTVRTIELSAYNEQLFPTPCTKRCNQTLA